MPPLPIVCRGANEALNFISSIFWRLFLVLILKTKPTFFSPLVFLLQRIHLCGLCSILFSVPSVLWHCWLGHLTCKHPFPYDLYCVGGTLSLTQSINLSNMALPLHQRIRPFTTYQVLSWPFYPVMGPWASPVGGFRGGLHWLWAEA